MPDYSAHYAETDRLMRELLGRTEGLLSLSEVAEVHELLEAREYGLALESLASILVEERKHVSPEIARRVDALAAAMHLGGAPFVKDFDAYAAARAG
jgi:hypothetical protein